MRGAKFNPEYWAKPTRKNRVKQQTGLETDLSPEKEKRLLARMIKESESLLKEYHSSKEQRAEVVLYLRGLKLLRDGVA